MIWVEENGRAGWKEVGSLPASELPAWSVWTQMARVVCATEARYVDYVSACTPGVFEIGPLAIPLDTRAAEAKHHASGGASIIGEIALPAWREAMAYECEMDGIGFTRAREDGGPVFTRGITPIVGDDLRAFFWGGSDGYTWTEKQKAISGRWVAAISRLLRQSSSRTHVLLGVANALRHHVEDQSVRAQVDGLLQRKNVRPVAIYLALAVQADAAAKRLANFAGWDATRMLEAAAMAGPWPETFAARVPRLRGALDREKW